MRSFRGSMYSFEAIFRKFRIWVRGVVLGEVCVMGEGINRHRFSRQHLRELHLCDAVGCTDLHEKP